MPRLIRGTCPVCKGDLALRKDGSTRQHPDHQHELYGVGRGASVPWCKGSGELAIEQARRLGVGS